MLKVLHTGDIHFSPKSDKLEENIRTSDAVVFNAQADKPDLILVTGDLADEYDGVFRVDSLAARALVSWVMRLASVAPVLVVRGTRSHDREIPWLLSHLKTVHPVHVALWPQQIYLDKDGYFENFHSDGTIATISCFPSPDKGWIASHGASTITELNEKCREAIRAVCEDFYKTAPNLIPHILAAHGSVRGAVFSSGTQSLEDIEFLQEDFLSSGADYIALGHIHKYQHWNLANGSTAAYCGSVGRNDFGETEEKGFIRATLTPRPSDLKYATELSFVKTPAREFAMLNFEWADGSTLDDIFDLAVTSAPSIKGKFTRFRYSVPETFHDPAFRNKLEAALMVGEPALVKMETVIIPVERTRAEGISRCETLVEKFDKYKEVSTLSQPDEAREFIGILEGHTVEELVKISLDRIDENAAKSTSTAQP